MDAPTRLFADELLLTFNVAALNRMQMHSCNIGNNSCADLDKAYKSVILTYSTTHIFFFHFTTLRNINIQNKIYNYIENRMIWALMSFN